MKRLAGLLLIVGLLLACGCSSMIREPKVALRETRLIGLDAAGMDMECRLTVSNPNSFDLSLLDIPTIFGL